MKDKCCFGVLQILESDKLHLNFVSTNYLLHELEYIISLHFYITEVKIMIPCVQSLIAGIKWQSIFKVLNTKPTIY